MIRKLYQLTFKHTDHLSLQSFSGRLILKLMKAVSILCIQGIGSMYAV